MLFKLAWRNIWRNRVRTLITLGLIFLAVILSTLMMSLKEGVYAKMIDSMVGNFMGYAQIHSNGFWEDRTLDNSMCLNDSLIQSLSKTNNLLGFTPRIESFALASSQDISKGSLVIGIDPLKESAFNQLNERVFSGNYLEPDDKNVLVGKGLAEKLNVVVGDTVVLLSQGYHGSSAAGKYHIKGLVKFGSPELSRQLVILSLPTAQWLYNLDEMYTSVILFPSKPSKVAEIIIHLRSEMGDKFEVMDWKEMSPDLVNLIQTDRVEGYVFMFILYMVISFGIFGTMLMMLSERTREFGVLVGVGMKRVKLAMMVFLELIIISAIGVIVGMICAFPICFYFYVYPIEFGDELTQMTEDYGMEAVIQSSIEPFVFVQQAVIVFFLAVIISIYPFLKIAGLSVIKSLKA